MVVTIKGLSRSFWHMARLPTPGGDDGTWGNILNSFLEVSHNSDGTLLPAAIKQAGAPVLDSTTSDIQPLGTQATGATGKAADAGHIHPTTGLALLSGATFTGYIAPSVASLTFGPSIPLNAAQSNVFSVTLSASTGALENPTNGVDGQIIRVRVTQGTGGPFTLAYGSTYDFGAAGQPVLSIAAGAVDVLSFEYNGAIAKWCYIGASFGF